MVGGTAGPEEVVDDCAGLEADRRREVVDGTAGPEARSVREITPGLTIVVSDNIDKQVTFHDHN